MVPFAEAVSGGVLVCDGAMGTMLYADGVLEDGALEVLNVTEPDRVAAVHRAYVEAGADVIESNTFGANRFRLGRFGLDGRLTELNRAGVTVARAAADDRVYVAGTIGPLGVPLAPRGRVTPTAAERAFREQADALAGAGVDLLVLETFGALDEILAALRGARGAGPLPIVAQMTTREDGCAADGTPPEVFGARLVSEGATVVGVNCGLGPASMLGTVERLAAGVRVPLVAQPSAGLPRLVEGHARYGLSPGQLASYTRRFTAAGVRLVGGCCGTTPDHIRQVGRALAAIPS